MKLGLGAAVALVMLGAAVTAQEAKDPAKKKEGGDTKTITRFFYAKVTDRNGEDEYRVLSQEELGTLQDEISAEGRCYSRALIATEAEWKKNEDTKKKPFPNSALKPRKVAVLQSFNDRAAADKKLQSQLERDAGRAEREKSHQPGGAQRTKEQQADETKREAARMALEDRARSIFEGKLAEMIAGAKKPADAAAPAAPK